MAWGGGWHSLTSSKTPTQLLFIQQPPLTSPSRSISTPSSSLAAPQCQVKKGGGHSSQNHKSKNSYLPILNSYPRIAPHPRKESHENKGATHAEGVKDTGGEGQSQSKRVCIEEEKKMVLSSTSHLLKPQQQKEGRSHSYSHYKDRGGHGSFPSSSHFPLLSHTSTTQHKSNHCQQNLSSDSVSSPSISSSQTPSPPSSSDSPSSSSPPSLSPSSSTAYSPYCLAPDSSSTRQRRFLNTAEILNQSGLLAITLRTKELLKQNAATEKEITQLRQHTHLLFQIANQNGFSDGPDSLKKLLQAMTESHSYPNLDLNQLKVLSSPQHSKARSGEEKDKDKLRTAKTQSNTVQMVSLRKIDDGTSPPSPLFAPSPEIENTEDADIHLSSVSTSHCLSFPRPVAEQGHRQALLDKDLSDLSVLPESTTHNNDLL